MQALPNSGLGGGYSHGHNQPLLSLDPADSELDYASFLQDQQDIDLDYFAGEESTSSSGGPLLDVTSPSVYPDASMQALAPQPSYPQHQLAPRQQGQQQQLSPATSQPGYGGGYHQYGNLGSGPHSGAISKPRMERRGHTKSRRGCFNCKRRRIKCQETRPACGHCTKQGLQCEYPALPTIVHQPQHQVPLFSLQDMRFFQHFLMRCYPHHPVGSEDLWTHEIPCLSERYDYLMHAILGYSASELMANGEPALAEAAMAHRYKAVKAIKKSLSPAAASAATAAARAKSASPSPGDPPSCPLAGGRAYDHMFEEGNALMATCFALTYQSVLLDDGMIEFMTFVRGIMIVAIQMYCKGANIMFGHLLGDRQTQKLEPHMKDLPLIETDWSARAIASVEGLRGLVEGREVEQKYWQMIGDLARNLQVDSWKAYLALSDHYGWWMMLPHDKFKRLVDPNNQAALLLATHWVALEQTMTTICQAEKKAALKMPSGNRNSSSTGASLGNIRWLRYMNTLIDAEHRKYNQWPTWVSTKLAENPGFFGRTFD
ncbi:uncharacterized protein C8A04DRAFT_9792 [Dichotomopilus funicola]|uniref:Zn(2)-C6 fungal-type domain-containing protein n=1 Tax=Dichotomopilus funicola TaxID=1934379 RepID=A0AAN6ZP43_9PEZI|nr:hypothetical protein C8A04DRAFT_9792 [Dichotomopilus funicola]